MIDEKDFVVLDSCVACGNHELIPTLNLGNQPLANSYTKEEDEILPEFPLMINRCSNCNHIQLSVAVNPDLMFKDYLYVSGTSKTLIDYFKWFADFTSEYYNNIFNQQELSVLDIGSNDGSMLDAFKNLGITTQGIDPAENLYEESSKKHNTICGYFDESTLPKLNSNANIITAQNVFAHNYDPLNFMKNVATIMKNNSLFFVQTSQANMILNNEFDTIYHEHISFYNIKSMKELCDRAGLFLIDVIKSPIHGTSYIFIIAKDEILKRSANIENLIKLEEIAGLYSEKTYEDYKNKCLDFKNNINSSVAEYRENGYKIIGYGAAAKGNTLLNFANLELDYIIDDNKLKQNYFTPGMSIKIVSIDILDTYSSSDKILFIPLAWNFFTEIKSKIKSKRDNQFDDFLLYFPTILISK